MTNPNSTLIETIESCNFECAAGPLALSVDWQNLKSAISLFVIVKGGEIVSHTSGKGGWRFLVHTNEAEAQATAEQWNRERYGGRVLCEVRPLLTQPTSARNPLTVEHASFDVLNEIWEHFDGIADGAPDASHAAKMALQFSEPLKRLIEQLKVDAQ